MFGVTACGELIELVIVEVAGGVVLKSWAVEEESVLPTLLGACFSTWGSLGVMMTSATISTSGTVVPRSVLVVLVVSLSRIAAILIFWSEKVKVMLKEFQNFRKEATQQDVR